jgi:GNAT superfamily N-acetyltransferase
MAPLEDGVARSYWSRTRAAMAAGSRIVLGAFESDVLVGSVQLDLAGMPNGRHRAEVVKLIVHRDTRGKGIGRTLMRAIEDSAREAGRQLLVLDTRVGDTASHLYAKIGYPERLRHAGRNGVHVWLVGVGVHAVAGIIIVMVVSSLFAVKGLVQDGLGGVKFM